MASDENDFGLPPGFELEDDAEDEAPAAPAAPVTPDPLLELEDDETGADIDKLAFDEEKAAGGAMPGFGQAAVPGTTAKVPMPKPMKLGGPTDPGLDPSLDPFKTGAPQVPTGSPAPAPLGVPSAPRGRAPRFTADVEDAITKYSAEFDFDENWLRTFVKIESGGDPNKRTGSYKGALQLSDKEFARFGGGNIYNPHDNVRAGVLKLKAEAADFQRKYGREPTPFDIYMVHQQGAGGYDAHMRNPDRKAWENMFSTAEGRQKGAGWSRQAIWDNVPNDMKPRYRNVDNMTSRDFLEMWAEKARRISGGGQPVRTAQLGGAAATAPPPGFEALPPGFEIEGAPAPAPAAGAAGLPPGFEIETPGRNKDRSTFEAATDLQDYKEIGKGLAKGGISTVGTGLQGPDALASHAQHSARNSGAKMLEVIKRIDAGETVHPSEDVLGYQEMDPTTRANTRTDLERAQAAFNPTPIQERSLYKKGEEVKEYAKTVLPAAKGYEDSWGRQVGEGLGSMLVTIPAAFLGPVGGTAVLASMGVGEATSRAIEFDKKERAAGRPGLTQDQIAVAGLYGIGPGTTDLLPLETLLGRLPLPVPAAARGALAKAVGRIGGQAFVEGMQEGGQQFLQNLIAREVYNPNQSLGEDVPGNVAIGGAVGGIAQGGKEVIGGLFGRRGRGAKTGQEPTQEAPPPVDPSQPPADPQAAPAAQPGAQPAAPQGGAQLPEVGNIPWEERSILTKGGVSAETLADMEPEERAQAVADFKAQGITADPEPARAPDAPSAEPLGDILAQAKDLADPGNPRKGLYLSPDNLAEIEGDPAKLEAVATAIGQRDVIENVDGKGGLLLLQDAETGAQVREALAGGADFQTVVGTLTGAGTGKPADGTHVVQQLDEKGNVTRESLVRQEDIPATVKAFQAPGRTTRSMPVMDAMQRREEGVAAEGTRAKPLKPETPEDLVKAGGLVAEPTEAQKKAGNYQKAHVNFQGLDISIENPKGSTRTGTDPNGQPWSVEMPAHYGDIKRTEGADGDKVDVYIGDNLKSDRAFIVDQVDADSGQFDEHKVMLGFDSREEAINTYKAAFSDGAGSERIGTVREMSMDEFKAWLKDGDTTAPAAPTKRKPRRYNETGNALQFIKNKGGIRPDADLTQIVDGARIVGLLSKNGLAPDRMREALVEEGFLQDRGGDGVSQSSLDDLYGLVDRIVRGERVGQYGQKIEKPVSPKAFKEESRRQILADASDLYAEIGAEYDLRPEEENRLVQLVEDEYMSVADALERVAIEGAENETAPDDSEGSVDEAPIFGLPDRRPRPEEAVSEPGEASGRPRQDEGTPEPEAAAEVENTRGPSEALTADEIEYLVAAWEYVKEVDTQVRAGKDISDVQISTANELDADLYSYGVSIDDHKTEEEVRQHLGSPREDTSEGSGQPEGPEAAEGQDPEDGGRESPERGGRETEAVDEPKTGIERLREQLITFASGMSRVTDLAAGANTAGGMKKIGIGVDVSELTTNAIHTMARAAVDWKTQLFIDSGAFSVFRRNLRNKQAVEKELGDLFGEVEKVHKRIEPLDFDEVMKRYDRITETIGEYNEAEESIPPPLIVMPDVVGDQAASLELLEKYKPWIKVETEFDLNRPIVPIQRGELSLAEAYAKAVEILGTDRFIVGIPSNEKAVPIEELKAFLEEAQPKRIHFLGAASPKNLEPKLQAIADAGLELEHLSADGNMLRSALYGRRQIDGTRGEAVSTVIREKAGDEATDVVEGPKKRPKLGAGLGTLTQQSSGGAEAVVRVTQGTKAPEAVEGATATDAASEALAKYSLPELLAMDARFRKERDRSILPEGVVPMDLINEIATRRQRGEADGTTYAEKPGTQTSFLPEPTTQDQIRAESVKKGEKGKGAEADAGPLFNPDAGKQTDLVDQAREPAKDGFDPAQHIKLVADDISKVRKSDIQRLFEEAPRTADAWTDLRVYIANNRPDLVAEALDVIGDLGGLPKTPEEIADGERMAKNREERAELNRRIVPFIQDYLRKGGTIRSSTVYRVITLSKPEHIRVAKDGTVQIPEGSKWVSLFDSGVDDLAKQAGWKEDAKPDADDDVIDAALDDQFGKKEEAKPAPAPAPAPKADSGKKAAASAKSAVKNTAKGLDEAVKGLMTLFDPKGKLGSGPAFDEETYAKAKPHFQAAVAHFAEAGADVATAVRELVRHLAEKAGMSREGIEAMRPYIRQFMADYRDGKLETPAAADEAKPESLTEKLRSGGFRTIVEARKFLKEAGLVEADATPKEMDEFIETAVVQAAREIVAEGKTPEQTFNALVELYKNQPNLGSRTGTSMANQAYSTPIPLAYVASRLANVAKADVVYEPTAGNGALLIEAGPGNDEVYANEIDPNRRATLEGFGFTVSEEDGTKHTIEQPADAIVMNPPFGAVHDGGKSKVFKVGDFKTTQIDHAVVMKALESMTPNGKAVLILGGVNAQNMNQRRQGYRGEAKRDFFYRLYNQYRVTDHFTVDGDLYKKQGAGWPVDVIVIEGKGKSERKLPAADPPVILTNWEAIGEKINGRRDAVADRPDQPTVDRPVEAGTRPASVNAVRRPQAPRSGSDIPLSEQQGDAGDVRPGDNEQRGDVGSRRDDAASNPDSRRDDRAADNAPPAINQRGAREEAKGGQVTYHPVSTGKGLNTLVPVNMADASRNALERIAEIHGNLDTFVAERLGYKSLAELGDAFGAEQIDALAAAIHNVENGSAMIIGDQTGIGKGRVVAGMLRYAMLKGKIPVLITEKPNLYGDMFRDLRDIGVPDMLGRDIRMMMTNIGERVPLDEAAVDWKIDADIARANKEIVPKERGLFLRAPEKQVEAWMWGIQDDLKTGVDDRPDVIFTTYDQLNTVRGETTARRRFLDRIAPHAMIVMDESHNAGGSKKSGWEVEELVLDRAAYAREIAGRAWGMMFSSATYAKRPDVMDLYARTDMGRAVEDAEELPELIARGGVPMQQIVASMLAEAGQYMRRERSFDGVEYALKPVEVDTKAYRQFSESMRAIFRFDLDVAEFRSQYGEDELDGIGWVSTRDDGVGSGAANSTSFGSLMHNIVNQMLLAIKADITAEEAIQAHKRGEKPVIALALTNETFIKDFAEENDIEIGKALDLDFAAVLKKYLERTLRITLKPPGRNPPKSSIRHIFIPVDRLPDGLREQYQAAMAIVESGSFENLPISPIDWIRHRLQQAGMSVKEVTGRQTMIDYGKGRTYTHRPKGEQGAAGRSASILYFNSGKLDALILNRSGATGLSIHASAKFKDQRRRRMILAQPEGNIDTHLQMLGRVHRTGQIIPPAYSQIAANIPAEARPTAVLMKKMASLNANTTGARGSAFTVDAIDFMNEIGDEVVANRLLEDLDLNYELGEPLVFNEQGRPFIEDVSRKATGRLTLLDVEEQTAFLNEVQQAYTEELRRLDEAGENPLEAKTIDLKAVTVETTELKPKQGDTPFLDAVRLEKITAKAQGRALAPSEVIDKTADFLKIEKPQGQEAQVLAALEQRGRQWSQAEQQRLRQQIVDQIEMVVAATKPDARESARHQAQATYQRWQATMNVAHPGARVVLGDMAAGDVVGIVIGVERTGKAKAMAALGSWTVKIAVADSMRQMEFPMTRLFPEGFVKGDGEKGATINFTRQSFPELIQAFENARREGRETRYMVTGNLLGGYDQVRGSGRIVNFTMEDGSIRPGILMSREFAVDRFMERRKVRLTTGEHIVKFLDRAPLTEVVSKVGDIAISFGRGEYAIEMKYAGNRPIFTDRTLLEILSPNDFRRQGQKMRVTNVSRAQITRAAEQLMKVGAKFEVRSDQEIALEIVGGGQSGSAAVGFTDTVIKFLSRNRVIAVSEDVREEMFDVIRPMMKMVAPGTQVGVVKRIVPGKMFFDENSRDNQELSVTFETPDGDEVILPLRRSTFQGTRAFHLDGRYSPTGRSGIFFLRLNSTRDLARTVTGELWHEVLHDLRRSRRLTGAVWDRLLAHAKSLRILDGQLVTYLRQIGDLTGEGVDDITLRETYTWLYRDKTPEFQSELMDEEEVAHFLELASHGELLPMEIDPVRDILQDIWLGTVARNPSARPPALRARQLAGPVSSAIDAAVGADMRREFDRLGFYSQALEAARSLKQGKGTPEQMLAQMKKAGVKEAELELTGLKAFLTDPDRKSVTQTEIVRHLRQNRVQLRERVATDPYKAERLELGERLYQERKSPNPDQQLIDEIKSRLSEIEIPEDERTQWSDFSLDPNNPSYRETVIYLPMDVEVFEAEMRAKYGATYRDSLTPDEAGTLARMINNGRSGDFISGHFPEPNIVGHMMASIVKDYAGAPVYLIDQIQSDWGQAIRDRGTIDDLPGKLDALANLKEELAAIPADPPWINTNRSVDRKHLDNLIEPYTKWSILRPFAKRMDERFGAILKIAVTRGDGDWEAGFKSIQEARRTDIATPERIEEVRKAVAERPELKKGLEEIRAAAQAIEDRRRIRAEIRQMERNIKNPVPSHPLVNTTDQWVNTTLRRAIKQAIAADAEYIAIPSGETVLSYNPGDYDGMTEFYNRIVPKNLRNILTKIDKTVEPKTVKQVETPYKGMAGKGFTVFPLTDTVKAKVQDDGLPLFSAIPRAPEAGSAPEAGGLTAAAESKKADIERALEIVARMTGGQADVRFPTRISLDGVSEKDIAAARAMGADLVAQGTYRAPIGDGRALIEVALGRDMATTAGHEAYHHVERMLANEAEMRLLRSPSEMARATQMAAVELGQPVERVQKMADYEIRAIAFQRYRRMREEGGPSAPLHIGVRRLWDRMIQMLRNIQNALKGMGFDSMESIFERARTGELASRAPGPAPTPAPQPGAKLLQALSQTPDPEPVDEDVMASIVPRFIARRTEGMLDRIRQQVQDQVLPMRREEEGIEDRTGIKLPPWLSPYLRESLYHGRAGERQADLRARYWEPLVEVMREAGISKEAFDDFLYARHAHERNVEIAKGYEPGHQFYEAAQTGGEHLVGGSGMSKTEADAILKRVAAMPQAAAYQKAADLIDKMIDETLELQFRSGLITREQYDLNKRGNRWNYYVPLRGTEQEEDFNTPGRGRGYDVRGREWRSALGRRSKADSPLGYALQQAQMAIVRSEKNRVDRALLSLVESHPDPDLWRVYKGELKRRRNPDTGLVESYWVPPLNPQKNNIFGVKVGGKQRYIEIKNPQLAHALRTRDPGVWGTSVGQAIYKLSRIYAQLVTSWNPEFVISNFFRDIETALINVGDIAKLPKGTRTKILKEALAMKSIRGVFKAVHASGFQERLDAAKKRIGGSGVALYTALEPEFGYAGWFEEYRLAGGKISFMDMFDVEGIKKDFSKDLNAGNIRRALGRMVKVVDAANTSVENSARLSLYITLRKNGFGTDQAASAARELTVNFNRKGELGPSINALYLFFNASIQGTTRMVQAFSRSKTVQVAVGSIFAAGFLLDVLNRMVAGDDDDGENAYDKIKPWIKEKNLIIMLPGRKDYLMIPLAYGYNIPYLAGQGIASAVHGKTKPMEALSRVAGAAFESFSPFGAATSFNQFVAPTMLDPIVQVNENKKWYGGPIQPRKWDEKKPDSENFFASVPPGFIDVARALNSWTGGNQARPGYIDVSPNAIAHFVEFAGGGVSRFFLNALNTGKRAATGQDWLPEQTPFVRRVYGGKGSLESRRFDFHEKWNEIDKAHDEMRKHQRERRFGEAEAVRKESPAELQVHGQFQAASKQLSAFRKKRDEVQLNRQLSSEEKQKRLDAITTQENELILRALAAYQRAKKQKETTP